MSPSDRCIVGALALTLLLAAAGACSSSDPSQPATPSTTMVMENPQSTSQTVSGATSSVPIDSTIDFSFRDSQSYSYTASITVKSLIEDVASALPGRKYVSVGDATLIANNTTPGRTAPIPLFYITIAMPKPACTERTKCKDGFLVLQHFTTTPDGPTGAGMASGASETYFIGRGSPGGENWKMIDETANIANFYWTLSVSSVTTQDFVSGWHSVGSLPLANAPKFTEGPPAF